jgi:hypothetical protein
MNYIEVIKQIEYMVLRQISRTTLWAMSLVASHKPVGKCAYRELYSWNELLVL